MAGERIRGRKTGEQAFFMEVDGKSRVILSGCNGIAAYMEDCVSVHTAVGRVTVYGRQLEMGCMTYDGAMITGRVDRIEFEE